jgi:hypothetical protein
MTPARTAHPVAIAKPPAVAPTAPVTETAAAPAPSPAAVARPASQHVGAAEASTSAYAAAHRAHFVHRDWFRALALWTRYLRLAPSGPLAPEAHWNRAICLLHLDRRADARSELQPFARGLWGSYRRSEAQRLLDSIITPTR